jgi:hypothetical protein
MRGGGGQADFVEPGCNCQSITHVTLDWMRSPISISDQFQAIKPPSVDWYWGNSPTP